MDLLDDYIMECIIQEIDLHSFSKALSSGNKNSIDRVAKMLPKVNNLKKPKNKAKRIKGFEAIHKKEMNKFSRLSPESKELAAMVTSPLVAMNDMLPPEKKNSLNKIVTDLRNALMKSGRRFFTSGALVIFIAYLGKYLFEATINYPEIRAIFNAAKRGQKIAELFVLIGVILMVISYLIKYLQQKRKEDKQTKKRTSATNPYDEVE